MLHFSTMVVTVSVREQLRRMTQCDKVVDTASKPGGGSPGKRSLVLQLTFSSGKGRFMLSVLLSGLAESRQHCRGAAGAKGRKGLKSGFDLA